MKTTSPVKKRPGSPLKKGLSYEETLPLQRRLSMMSKNPEVTADDMNEYQKTEIIRKSVTDVKMRAENERVRRESPRKTYANVKSKVAGNMKSQKKAKKNEVLVAANKYIAEQVVAGNTTVLQEGAPIDLLIRSGSPMKSNITFTGSPSKRSTVDVSPERTRQIESKQREL